MAYFDAVNAAGGVNGRQIVVRAYDDGYNPTPAIDNTIQLVEQDDVFLLFNYVGTPTVTRVLPLLSRYQDQSMYLFFPFTGAQPQREPPYEPYVFNLRASYRQETAGLVDNFVSAGRNRVAVFYQADAYGRSGWDGVKRALDPPRSGYRGRGHLSSRRRLLARLQPAGGDSQSCRCGRGHLDRLLPGLRRFNSRRPATRVGMFPSPMSLLWGARVCWLCCRKPARRPVRTIPPT